MNKRLKFSTMSKLLTLALSSSLLIFTACQADLKGINDGLSGAGFSIEGLPGTPMALQLPFSIANTGSIDSTVPRLDDVTMREVVFQSGSATGFLLVHGANFADGNTIYINGVQQPTSLYKIYDNSDNMAPMITQTASIFSTLKYPIYQYGTLACPLDTLTMGSDITVTVKRANGLTSNPLIYHLPANFSELDSDDDGLLDDWEINGYDADNDGTIDVDLPALGADPLRKDLFIEVDWMTGLEPNPNLWGNIEDTFATAPVLNSDGTSGISIHMDHGSGTGGGGGPIPWTNFIRYDDFIPPEHQPGQCLDPPTYTNFYTAKSNHFDPKRLRIFRYAIFAYDHGHTPGRSGRAEDIWSNDFFVSLGFSSVWDDEAYQTGTFLHELGHTLNLRHGGDENNNSKDNYNSVMNYGNEGTNNASPSSFGGIDINCNLNDVDGVYSFSQGQRKDLDENHLNETIGVCDNVPYDFNGNGSLESDLAFNVDNVGALEVIEDHADWANIELKFTGPDSNWDDN